MSGFQKPTRRYHKKSRTGCTQCRSRRIKCDETRPSCTHCQRAELSCLYRVRPQPQAQQPLSVSPAGAARSTASPSHGNGPGPGPGISPPAPAPAIPSEPSAPGAGAHAGSSLAFDMLDLSLMHHYATSTSSSLFGEEQRSLWQLEVPSMARSSPLLMHGLLATSALHLAFLHRDDAALRPSYTSRALYHHSLGLGLFNARINVIGNEDSNSHVLFTFGLFLVIWAYASPGIPSILANEQHGGGEGGEESAGAGAGTDLDALLSSLDLVRGNKIIFELSAETISAKPIGAFTKPSNRSVPRTNQPSSSPASSSPSLSNPTLLNETQRILSALRAHIATDVIDTTAIDHLERFLSDTISSSASDMRLPLGWPALIEAPFWERVKMHRTPALLILLHYAVLLACYEGRAWWMRGWAGWLMGSVGRVLENSGEGERGDWRECAETVRWLVERVRGGVK